MKTNRGYLWLVLFACLLSPWQALRAQNPASILTIVQPTNQARYIAPVDLFVSVELNDPERRVYSVDFLANTNLIGTRRVPFRPRPGFGIPLFFVGVGEYTLTAVARAGSGEALATSAPVRITVEFSCETGVVILPQVDGSVANLPELGLLIVQGDQDAFIASYFKTTDMNRTFRRGFTEFFIPVLPVRFSSATLVLTGTSKGVDLLELSYYAADLAIETNDFDRPTVPWIAFTPPQTSPTGSAQTVFIDVTSLVTQFEGANLGFRIKLPEDPAYDQFDGRDAGFHTPRLVLNTCSNPPPPVSVWALYPIASEGSRDLGSAEFLVWHTGPTNSGLTVHYSILGSAINGIDYRRLPGSVTIPAGRRFARVQVWPVNDRLVEAVETVVLNLEFPPANLDPGAYLSLPPAYLLDSHRRATAYILDNDHRNRREQGRR